MKKRLRGLTTVLLILSLHSVHAALVVDQPLDPEGEGAFSNLGPANQQVANAFVINQVSRLQSVSWVGRYASSSVSAPDPTTFSIRFFTDSAGVPAISPISEESVEANPAATGENYEGIPWYNYSANLVALTLDPGTYWLSIVEDDSTTHPAGDSQWLWADASSAGARAVRINDLTQWVGGAVKDQAFSLTATVVPVPAAVWLFGSGLLGLVAIAKRKQAA